MDLRWKAREPAGKEGRKRKEGTGWSGSALDATDDGTAEPEA